MKTVVVLFSLFFLGSYSHATSKNEFLALYKSCNARSDMAPIEVSNGSTNYDLGIEDGTYTIHARVQLRYSHYFSSEELTEAYEILEETKSFIVEYYAKYGLKVKIDFEHAPYDSLSRAGHPTPVNSRTAVVYIRRNTGYHMKSTYWGVNRDMDFIERAHLITHEFSHLLGLGDEYSNKVTNISRDEEDLFEEDSLMKNTDHEDPKLYPRHIQQIIEPICDKLT